MKYYSSMWVFLILFFSCKKEKIDDGIVNPKPVVMCNIFIGRIIIIVKGDSLTNHYALNISTSDTLRYDEYSHKNYKRYTVLEIEDFIRNRQDYVFIREINDSIVIKEHYNISIGDCALGSNNNLKCVELKTPTSKEAGV